jgi:hypothetical protein
LRSGNCSVPASRTTNSTTFRSQAFLQQKYFGDPNAQPIVAASTPTTPAAPSAPAPVVRNPPTIRNVPAVGGGGNQFGGGFRQ